MLGAFTFILHTHLPYVMHHGKWPHGTDWLSEAVVECYIPILEMLDRLDAEGIAPRISMDFSPINLEQLSDPGFEKVFVEYCDEKISAAEKDYRTFRTNGEQHLQPLAEYWREFYDRSKKLFLVRYQSDVVSAFRALADKGILDAMTCGATHGYFPLLLRDENIRAQLRCAIASHESHFGRRPRGIWLPECGYRPRYFWSPPVGPDEYRAQKTDRAGVEELLAEVGLEYFVVDGSLTRGGVTVPSYPFFDALHEHYVRDFGPEGEGYYQVNPDRSLTEIYDVRSTERPFAGRAPSVFSRDPNTAARVWAADMGYPGAGVYLDFHKKHHDSGLRYWSITGPKIDLADKQPYRYESTEWQLDYDARDFVSLVRAELVEHAYDKGRPGILAAPFDTELFGHWWFEGPRFLEKVMRLLHKDGDIRLTNCADAMATSAFGGHTTIALPEGSWGEGGHHYVWANDQVAWMWNVIYPLEERFLAVLRKLKSTNDLEEHDLLETIMHQAARELLLLESSDWQFVISTGGAIDYSKERFQEHAELLAGLLSMAENYDSDLGLTDEDAVVLQSALVKDRPFETIDLDWWL